MNIFRVSSPTTSGNVFQAKILKMDNGTDIVIRLAERILALQVKKIFFNLKHFLAQNFFLIKNGPKVVHLSGLPVEILAWGARPPPHRGGHMGGGQWSNGEDLHVIRDKRVLK